MISTQDVQLELRSRNENEKEASSKSSFHHLNEALGIDAASANSGSFLHQVSVRKVSEENTKKVSNDSKRQTEIT